MSDEIKITEEMRKRHPDWDEKTWALDFRIKAKMQELAGVIDDGRYDPPETKIENHVGSLAHFAAWERELQQNRTYFKALATRLWALIEALGRTYIHGGY